MSAHLLQHTVDAQWRAKLNANTELEIRIDLLLRDRESRTAIAVIDTKYNDVASPAMDDIQQAAFYANEIGVERAFLALPATCA